MNDIDFTKEPLTCPVCGFNDLRLSRPETDTGIIWRLVTCGGCGTVWNEHFKFSYFEIVEEGAP